MNAIVIHGMGRTPLSMYLLAMRLRLAGMRPHLFGYSATLEGWGRCTGRLTRFIERHAGQDDYILVGHSLGTVLARAALPKLRRQPKACFLLAPPVVACQAACKFSSYRLYQWLTGEMGQLLAQKEFMEALPQPSIATKIYAGTGGAIGPHLPFGEQPNDGILALHETLLPKTPVLTVPSIHTFIMNNRAVAQDIVKHAGYNTERSILKVRI
jgi:alpha-beta hydrolase superfamily lysophospholipase